MWGCTQLFHTLTPLPTGKHPEWAFLTDGVMVPGFIPQGPQSHFLLPRSSHASRVLSTREPGGLAHEAALAHHTPLALWMAKRGPRRTEHLLQGPRGRSPCSSPQESLRFPHQGLQSGLTPTYRTSGPDVPHPGHMQPLCPSHGRALRAGVPSTSCSLCPPQSGLTPATWAAPSCPCPQILH